MRRAHRLAAPLCALLLLCSCGGPVPDGDGPEKPLLAYTRVTYGEAPDVPGGERCAAEGGLDVAALYPGGRRRVLTDDHLSRSARISPDGSRIAFASGRGGELVPQCGAPAASVYVMDADGSDPRRLTRAGGDSDPLEWSPDGERVAFSRLADGGGYGVWAVDADGGKEPERLVPGPADALAFSPDGRSVAYVRPARPGLSEDAIWTADADGGNARRLLADRRLAAVSDLEFSPDGGTLAVGMVDPDAVVRPRPGSGEFRIRGDGGDILALVLLDDPRLEELAETDPFSGVSWTADGRHLVYLGREERPRPHAVTPEGEEAALPEGVERVRTADLDWGPYPLDARGEAADR